MQQSTGSLTSQLSCRGARRQAGMTLLELLVVLVILGIVGGIFASNIIGQGEKGKTKAAKVQIEQFGQVLDMFRLDVGRYPTTAEGLDALIHQPSGVTAWNGPYMKKDAIAKDPWSNDYKYISPGQHGGYDIVSYGADGREGGDGDGKDITSWQ
jgi:general secretion pathway protein G